MPLLLAVIMVLSGAILIIIDLVTKQRAKAARTWPNTPGVILKSELVKHITKTSGVRTTSYQPAVEYQYTVMGQEITGKRLSFGSKSLVYQQAQEIAAKYPVGARVPVYYNPEKVSDSLLETTPMGVGTLLVIGILFAALGVVLLIVTLL